LYGNLYGPSWPVPFSIATLDDNDVEQTGNGPNLFGRALNNIYSFGNSPVVDFTLFTKHADQQNYVLGHEHQNQNDLTILFSRQIG